MTTEEPENIDNGLEMKMRRRKLLVAGAVLAALIVLAIYYSMSPKTGMAPARYIRPAEEQKEIAKALTANDSIRVYGEAGASVLIHAILPFDSPCHDRTVAMLRAFAAQYPKRVRFELYNMGSPLGDEMMQNYHTSCAHVYINGSSRFKIERGSKTVIVDLTGPENAGYTIKDLYTIMKAQIQQTWEKCPNPILPGNIYDSVMSGEYPGLEIKKFKAEQKAAHKAK